MDRLKLYYNNVKDVLISTTKEYPVIRQFGHAFWIWQNQLRTYIIDGFNGSSSYLTEPELRRLHRRFSHPLIDKLRNLLKRLRHEVDTLALQYLTRYCSYCQKHGKLPGRFKFTLQNLDIEFNYTILVDIIYITNKAVLYIVDEATGFQAVRWLQNISAKHVWDVLRMCWIDTYIGPPDMITYDAKKNFISKDFKHLAIIMGITTKIVLVEVHWLIGKVERYYVVLRRTY